MVVEHNLWCTSLEIEIFNSNILFFRKKLKAFIGHLICDFYQLFIYDSEFHYPIYCITRTYSSSFLVLVSILQPVVLVLEITK